MKAKTTLKTPIKKYFSLKILLVFIFFSSLAFAQEEETWKEATIFEFTAPYEKIVISFDDEEFTFLVNEKTEFLRSKRKSIDKDKIFPGSTADISFVIENRKRVLTKIMVSAEEEEGNKFEGVFEVLEGDIAYVDGRKVMLTDKTSIKCKGGDGCNCSKGRSFLDLTELPVGSFLTVTGNQGANGIYMASKIEVCKNVYTNNDKLLMKEVAKSFDASNMSRIKLVPENSFNPSYGLHEGNIKIGSVDYKLLDNIRIQGYINFVGNRVLPEYTKEESFSQEHDVYFRFYVIDNDVPNAMAFPNGMIFINTGLLKLMENEAQLATVLGHEIAHVTYEHGAKRFKATKFTESKIGKKGFGWMKKMLKKKVNVADDGILGAAFDKALEYTTPENIMNIFDKKKETQSDRVGLFYMHNSGYDIREAAKFWQIMVSNTKNEKFMNKITSSTWDMINSIEGELDGDLLNQLGKEGSDLLVTQILETVYTSHPLSVKRFGDINRLLAVTYEGVDFSQYQIGKEEFDKYIAEIRE
ncbi:M48 family metalloprotease [Leptobacterium flavescens]|uniref:M48 family metalloprotease n=1 Tax=Leptobacterium flavescens TaxID=472055 RepID=A0A6P0UR54_9FLAO|nr:M48 family metalloprotease [Leptobacterium flavescens]NER12896.1 M48 family metalloprotease [Leptobacterium flavescens]